MERLKSFKLFACSFPLVLALFGCSGPQFTAKVQADEGKEIDSGSRVGVLWSVSQSSSDYVFAWGSGSLDSNGVTVSLPSSAPPDEALNFETLGVGLVMVFEKSAAEIPEGRLSDAQVRELRKHTIGGADRFALIFRRSDPQMESIFPWATQFPTDSITCGMGQHVDGRPFDQFVPTNCASIIVRISDQLQFVNWT